MDLAIEMAKEKSWCSGSGKIVCHGLIFFHFIRRRGTWYNRSVKKWYELDGFITHLQDRKCVVKKIKEVVTLHSDHNAVNQGETNWQKL